MADALTFVINPEGEYAPLRLFTQAVGQIERLIMDVDYAITKERSPQRWEIGYLHSSAPTVEIRQVKEGESVDAIANGLRVITVGTDEPPQYFTEQALQRLQRMQTLFDGRVRARTIEVRSDGLEAATIRDDIKAKAERILRESYVNLGSIEGDLEVINVHGAATFTVWERVSRAPVKCYFPNSLDWVDRVKALLKRRVMVSGEVRYFRNGVPRVVTDIREIIDQTPDTTLPRARFGAIPDPMARENPSEFLRAVREG